MSRTDDDILKDLRDAFDQDDQEWREIRDEGSTDVKILTGGIWDAMDPRGVQQRREAHRPIITLDELSQYVNQVINDLRQNKRGIVVSPVGGGATDQTAQFRQGKIRDIEYRSNAQQAYTLMAENAIQRGYGFLRIVPKYQSDDSFDQELTIEPVVNPELLTPDCHATRSDGSDLTRMWVRERLSVEEFKRNYPDADVRDITLEHARIAPKWADGAGVYVGEAWIKEFDKKRTRLLLKPPPPTPQNPQPGPIAVWTDELQQMPSSEQILKSKTVDTFRVVQYLTNGLEILSKTDWPGEDLPFVCCFGKIVYVQDGGMTKRRLLSLIRLARDPQMFMAYIATCEAELVGMTPKFPYFFYKGQLTKEALDLLAKSLHEPVAGIEVKPFSPDMQGQLLPFPQRQPYEPPIQALEALKESVRHSIQAALGLMPLPTQAQQQNEKSGIALRRISDTSQKGAYHFVDHFDESIKRTGTLLNDLMAHYYDSARDTSIRKPDDSVDVVRINDPQAQQDGKPAHIPVGEGDHDVTISVGPATESQREETAELVDAIVTRPELAQVLGPQKYAEIFALAVKLRNVGPLGDQIAEIVSPKQGQNDPKAMLQQMMAENQQLKAAVQQAQLEKQGKVVEQQGKMQITQLQEQAESQRAAMDRETKIAVAEITAQAKQALQDMALFYEERGRIGAQIHEQAMGSRDAVHASAVAKHAAAADSIEQSKDRLHERLMAEQTHQHALAQTEQQGQIAQAQAEQAQQADPQGGDGA